MMVWLYRHRRALQRLWLALAGVAVVLLVVLAVQALAGLWALLVFAVLAGLVGAVLFQVQRWVRRGTVLELDLEAGVLEQRPPGKLAELRTRQMMTVREVVEALERAAEDDRVAGVFARLGPVGMGLGHAQEIREAVRKVRRAGKNTVAWSPTLGEGGLASVEYYLAAAFERVYVQPMGDVGFAGLMVQQPFVRGLLEKLGVEPLLDHRRKYKTARNMFTERGMTDEHRESLEHLLDGQSHRMCWDVASDRRMEFERVRELMEQGPWLGEQAQEAGLIDGMAYEVELREQVKAECGGPMLYAQRYLARAGGKFARGQRIALVYATGPVTRGSSQWRTFPPGHSAGAADVAAALRQAGASSKVKAVVLRIESPGGSAVGSETIWHEVERLQEQGKPVVASMANVAGSGGYYMAASARRILALPGTITGSIGVVSGKLVTRQAWAKAGVNFERVKRGENADMWDAREAFSDAQWQRLQQWLDHVYEQFKQRVAKGRGLSDEQVEQVAQGRIWTGEAAQEHGLIDELGGLVQAVERAREAAGLGADQPVQLVTMGGPSAWEQWLSPADNGEPEAAVVAAELGRWLDEPGRVLNSVQAAEGGALAMGPMRVGKGDYV